MTLENRGLKMKPMALKWRVADKSKRHKSFIIYGIVMAGMIPLLFGSSAYAQKADEAIAICPRPEYNSNWGAFIPLLERYGISVQTYQAVPNNLSQFRLATITVSTKELMNQRQELFDWVKDGGKLVCVFLNDEWTPTDFFPYKITFTDKDPEDIEFVKSDFNVLNNISGKRYKGKTAVLAYSVAESKPAVLYADHGKGGILILQLHIALTRNSSLMRPLVKNIAQWANLNIKEIKVAADPYNRVANQVVYSAGPALRYDWGEGVLMYGLMSAYRLTKSPLYLKTIKDWVDRNTDNNKWPEILEHSRGHSSLYGYCGHWGPGAVTMMLYEETGDKKYLALTKEIWDFVRDPKKATRTSEGALGVWRGNVQIWVDMLCMVGPTFARYSKHINESESLDDAIKQIRLAAKHLQCKYTNLFYHMWDSKDNSRSPSFWGRGNGWVIISLVDVLEVLPQDHPEHKPLQTILQNQINALVRYQAPSGMWRTVIDRPDAYEETSATAMITYGIAKAMQLGIVNEEYRPVLRKAWKALESMVTEDGIVLGTSGSTDPGAFENYITRPQGEYTWGTGAFLMAGSKLKETGIID